MKKTVETEDHASEPDSLAPHKIKEVSKHSREQQLLLAGMLIYEADERAQKAREQKRKQDLEVIELRSGFKITIGDINAIVSGTYFPCDPMFPNAIPFFSEIARLSEVKFDPTEYIKPAFVGTIVCEIIYGRFDKSVLPALRAVNPAYTNGIRPRKLYHYLTPEGLSKLVQFRDEAIKVMETCQNIYEFRQKLFQQHGVPYQIEAFEKK